MSFLQYDSILHYGLFSVQSRSWRSISSRISRLPASSSFSKNAGYSLPGSVIPVSKGTLYWDSTACTAAIWLFTRLVSKEKPRAGDRSAFWFSSFVCSHMSGSCPSLGIARY